MSAFKKIRDHIACVVRSAQRSQPTRAATFYGPSPFGPPSYAVPQSVPNPPQLYMLDVRQCPECLRIFIGPRGDSRCCAPPIWSGMCALPSGYASKMAIAAQLARQRHGASAGLIA